MLKGFDDWFEGRDGRLIRFLSLFLVIGIFWVDALLDPFYSLWLLYGAPLALATWYGDRRSGIILAVLASVLCIVAALESGTYYPSALAIAWSIATSLIAYFVLVALLAKIRNKLNIEHDLARVDALTGSMNKRAFEEELEYLLRFCRRESIPLTVAYVDLDDFKQINDRYGHRAGDRVLQAISSALKEFTRRTDRVTRLGGDEFAVLFPDTDEEGARVIIEKARAAFAGAFSPGRPMVTCSIGVVTFERPPMDLQEAIHAADEVMYEVKANGKDSVKFITVPKTDMPGSLTEQRG